MSALRAAASLLGPGGAVLVGDEKVGETFTVSAVRRRKAVATSSTWPHQMNLSRTATKNLRS